MLAVILAALVRYQGSDKFSSSTYIFQENMNIPAYIFMSVIVALFVGMIVSAEEIFNDRKILKKEAYLDLSRLSYLLSKMFILFLITAIQMFTFVLIGNYILEIKGMLFIYWLVLFSAGCFANLLGLNISSAFNSVVTIYIIIPILLIPQILLSGVVVRFDQLNPLFGSKSRVPLIGDLMTSRWAYEALMVSQFKDNEFERIFYQYDKEIAMADYQNVYYLPELESKLEYAFLNRDVKTKNVSMLVDHYIDVLNHELPGTLNQIDSNKGNDTAMIDRKNLDSALFRSIQRKLEILRKMYVNRQSLARDTRQKIIASMTESPKKTSSYQQFKKAYTNEKVTSLVCQNQEKDRIIVQNKSLVQMIYPIYKDPDPENFFDFRAQFFVHKKYFAGALFDTPMFNCAIIWLMTLFLCITLYFDLLRKLVNPDVRKIKTLAQQKT